MRLFILSLILCFVYTTAYAQIPQQINYQGVLTDGSGAIVPDGNYNLTFTIYDAATAGNNLWTDTFNNVPTENGVFNVTLGSGAALNINFDDPYWIGIAVGGGSELTPRIALTSSPYSIRTKSIEITDVAGQSAVSAINAATSGKINAARLENTVTTQGNTFNGNSQLLQLNASGDVPAANLPDPLPVLSGANLTNLDASDLASGTVPTARLGSGTADNATFLRGDNTWAVPAGGGGSTVIVETFSNQSFNFPDVGQETFTFTVNGATTADGAFVAAPTVGQYVYFIASWVSAPNTVSVILDGPVTSFNSDVIITVFQE